MSKTLQSLREAHGVDRWGREAPVIVRLLRRIDQVGECWVWGGCLTEKGYGRVGITPSWRLAHRVSYELLVGPIPEGMQLDHLCRNRACVRPEHLEPVDNRENVIRGIGWTAKNAAKTHCPSGHEYDEANTYRWRGARFCRACRAPGARTAGRPYRAGAA